MYDPMKTTQELLKKTKQHHDRVMAHAKHLAHPTCIELQRRSRISLNTGMAVLGAGAVCLAAGVRKTGMGLLIAGALQMGVSGMILHKHR